MLNLKRDMLSVALASAIMAMAAQAQAQAQAQAAQAAQADEDEEKAEDAKKLDAVEVRSGIVAGIENAIDTKRDASSIVEAVSAEDIGKLPDFSIADSLARLPGVTAVRVRGRATDVNVRGLAGDFSSTTLNGREQASMGINRGVEFDQYASELMKQVLVYKTPTASLVGQGLSATIDLQTIRPLDFDRKVVAASIRSDRNELDGNDYSGERASLTYIDQNDARTMGVVLGYAYLNSPGQSNSWRAWGYEGNGLISGSTIQGRVSDNVREGINGTLEYRPNDSHRGSLDVFVSRLDVDQAVRGIEVGLGCCGGYLGGTLLSYDPATGTSRWSGTTPVFRSDFQSTRDDLLSAGWNHQWQVSEDWKITSDLSISRAERDDLVLETQSRLLNSTTLTVSRNAGGWFDMDYGIDFNDPSILRLGDVGGWGGDGFDKPANVTDEIRQIRIEAERAFGEGWLSAIQFGVNHTSREKDRFASETSLCLSPTCAGGQIAPYPLLADAAFGRFGIPFLPRFDVPSALGAYQRIDRFAQNGLANRNFGVEEDVTTGFIQANLDAELGGVVMTGNIGLQVQHVDQVGFGRLAYSGTGGAEVNGGTSYTELLPTLNLIFDLPAEQKIRFGAGRQAARPRIDDLSAGFSYGIDRNAPGGAAWRAGGGNPELKPWIANSYDIAWEKYFGGRGYISAAYFFKDLKNYIANQDVAYDFTPLLGNVPSGTLLPTSNIGLWNRPVNAEGGLVAGIELSVSVPFDLIWQPLEGFGLQGSYTDTRTSIDPSVIGYPELPGFSKYTSNVTLYWERFGWGIRATRRTRSPYVTEIQNVFRNFETVENVPEEIVDLQISYTVQEGPLKDLGFLFQIANVTDESWATRFSQDPNRPREFVEYGNNALFGISYKF